MQNDQNNSQLLSLEETAEMLGLSVWTLRKWDNNGKFKAVRVGDRKDRRYRKDDVMRVIKEGI